MTYKLEEIDQILQNILLNIANLLLVLAHHTQQ